MIVLLLLGLELAKVAAPISLVAAVLIAFLTAAAFAIGSWFWILAEFERSAALRTVYSYANIGSRRPATSNQTP
jgi:hypothetical protein